MPYYNYICPSGHKFEAPNTIKNRALHGCSKCNRMAQQTISRRPAAVQRFKFGWFEHLEKDPVYVKSKRHMQDLCEKNKVYAPGVLDG